MSELLLTVSAPPPNTDASNVHMAESKVTSSVSSDLPTQLTSGPKRPQRVGPFASAARGALPVRST